MTCFSFSEKPCFTNMKDKSISGTRIRAADNIPTAEACKTLCVKETGCTAFMYYPHKRCVLFSEVRGTSTWAGLIAGQACPGNKQISWQSLLCCIPRRGKAWSSKWVEQSLKLSESFFDIIICMSENCQLRCKIRMRTFRHCNSNSSKYCLV